MGGELRGNEGKIMSLEHFCSVDTKLSKTKTQILDISVYCSEERWRLKRYLETIDIKMVESTSFS